MKLPIIALWLFMTCSTAYCQTNRSSEYFRMGTAENPEGEKILVDSHGFVVDGKHTIPVMGEFHYSRVPEKEWRHEVRKMKAGGVTILATYVFWNHHEDDTEGVWDWSGNRNLRRFVEICGEEKMPVVLRIGPFCHGEVYQGGMPCWVVNKSLTDPNYKLRSTASGFISATEKLYNQIGAQVNGLMWKDGGPVVGVQLENECRGPWAYFVKLYDMARKAGLDVPFYTRTGWPAMNGKAEFGKILPLYGDYADGFWDRSLKDMPGAYPDAFKMKSDRISQVIATETFSKDDLKDNGSEGQGKGLTYPYLTCELGGGMMMSYHRRINMSGREAMALCVCKLGSGSNLPGYYMYHGGTNPLNPLHSMAETQNSNATNHNDMPHKTYDFQTILGEMGQPNPVSWNETRWVHQFLADWGDELCMMDVDSLSDNYARRGSFVFRNDYVRILNEDGQASITPLGMKWNGLTISSDEVQPFAKADGGLYFIDITGKNKCKLTVNGKNYTAKTDRTLTVGGKKITVLSQEKAKQAYAVDGQMKYGNGIVYKDGDKIMLERWTEIQPNRVDGKHASKDGKQPNKSNLVAFEQTHKEGALRTVSMGKQKVAAQPTDEDFKSAAAWTITLSPDAEADADNLFLSINYRGDCARVYADGVLVEDNFWNGKPMLVRVSDLVGKQVELKVLPLGKDAPIYLQAEQRNVLDAAAGNYLLGLDGIGVIRREVSELE